MRPEIQGGQMTIVRWVSSRGCVSTCSKLLSKTVLWGPNFPCLLSAQRWVSCWGSLREIGLGILELYTQMRKWHSFHFQKKQKRCGWQRAQEPKLRSEWTLNLSESRSLAKLMNLRNWDRNNWKKKIQGASGRERKQSRISSRSGALGV